MEDAGRQISRPAATVCIATCSRPDSLHATLMSWRAGTAVPREVRVVDASDDQQTLRICEMPWGPLNVTYIRSPIKSAAVQRNIGAGGCATDLLIVCDDDVEVPPHTLEALTRVFADDPDERVGGVAGTIEGMHHRVPGKWLRAYYWLQAGYPHEHYGGHFFGAAINLLPTDAPDDPLLYPAQWLNSTLAAYRKPLFDANRFPPFEGYSFQEDVNLSARIARTHKLYFHRGVRYLHRALPATYKADVRLLGRMQMAHRWYNATELLGLSGTRRSWKFLLSLAFEAIYFLRARPEGWPQHLVGSCAAWWALAVRRREARVLLEDRRS